MKKIICIILSVLILTSVFAVVPLSASAYIEKANDDFEYFIDEEENYVIITAYLGDDSEVVIPETLDDFPVEVVSDYAFDKCDFVTNIVFPDTLCTVGPGAIDDTAYYNNDDNWEDGVFYIGKILYAADDEVLEGEYTIKEGTISITQSAFVGCSKLTKLTIPGTVNNLTFRSFMRCTELTDLVVEEGTEVIGPGAFASCKKLKNIRLPKSIDTIYPGVFSDTAFYNNIYNWDNGALYLDNILLEVDYECSGDFYVREGTTLFANQAFSESNVRRVYLPYGIKRFPEGLFNSCRFLKEIIFNDDFEELGVLWSAYNDVMTTFEVPASVIKIDYRSFAFATFTDIKLNENLKEIGEQAFVSCEQLNEITVPKNVETIGDYAFGYIANTTLEGYTLEKIDDFVIKGYAGSKAEEYANKFGFKFVDLSIKDISECTVSGIRNKTYNGKAQTQNITVKDGDKTLVSGTDYTLAYKNNKNAGTASLTITGKGDYKGSVTKIFKIAKANNPMTVKVSAKTVKSADFSKKFTTVKAITVKKAQGKVSYKKTSGKSNFTVNSKTGEISIKKGTKKGAYKINVKISAAGNNNYKSKSVQKTVTIKVNNT